MNDKFIGLLIRLRIPTSEEFPFANTIGTRLAAHVLTLALHAENIGTYGEGDAAQPIYGAGALNASNFAVSVTAEDLDRAKDVLTRTLVKIGLRLWATGQHLDPETGKLCPFLQGEGIDHDTPSMLKDLVSEAHQATVATIVHEFEKKHFAEIEASRTTLEVFRLLGPQITKIYVSVCESQLQAQIERIREGVAKCSPVMQTHLAGLIPALQTASQGIILKIRDLLEPKP